MSDIKSEKKILLSMFITKYDNEKRIEEMDFLKGIAVILVWMGHATVPCSKYFLTFHMALFFILSGMMFYRIKNKSSFEQFIWKKFKRLIIPYCIFEIINLIISCLILMFDYFRNNELNILLAFRSIITCINADCYEGICQRLWFLPCIFWSDIMLFLFIKCNKYISLGVIVLISTFSAYLPFRLPFAMDISMVAILYTYMGYIFGKFLWNIVERFDNLYRLIIVLVFIFIWLPFAIKNSEVYMYINEYGNFWYSVITGITGSVAIIALISIFYSKLKKRKSFIKRYICWLGINSLYFFPIHLDILYFARAFLSPIGYGNWGSYCLVVVILSVPLINLCLLIDNACGKK